MNSHPYKKKWGQNFIKDQNTIKKIITLINPQKTDRIIEIGPGTGALTNDLSKITKELIAVEIDPLLCKRLQGNFKNDIKIINEDILKLDLNKFNNYNKIVGNLPYYITTPIIFKILEYSFWDKIIFMIQKEVAERIVAPPGSKTYGRLSVMVQVTANVEKKFNVSKNIFYPKPKVDSSLIELTLKKNNDLIDINKFSEIVKKSFNQRRKILKNSLADFIPIDAYDEYKNKRPEELSVNDYIKISNNI